MRWTRLRKMAGSGVVRDLREAMSLGNSASDALVSAVQAFAAGSTRDAQMASLDELLRTWAGTQAIADRFTIQPVGAETRRFVVTGSTDTALQAKLARIIPVLEVFNGNTVTAQATVTRTNGTTTQIDSVAVGADSTAGNLNLASNPFYREFTDSIPLTTAALALPEMAGSGVVRDLREAHSPSMPFFSSFTADGVNDEKKGEHFFRDACG